MKALQGGVGPGQQQVTSHADRVERSVTVAIRADWLRRKRRAEGIPADRPWSAFRLHWAVAWGVMPGPCACAAHHVALKWLQLGNAA
jgi:hypothetical protein